MPGFTAYGGLLVDRPAEARRNRRRRGGLWRGGVGCREKRRVRDAGGRDRGGTGSAAREGELGFDAASITAHSILPRSSKAPAQRASTFISRTSAGRSSRRVRPLLNNFARVPIWG